MASFVNVLPELVERTRPLPLSATHTSPSRSGAGRSKAEPPAASVLASAKLAPPSWLTISLPVLLS